MYLNIRYYNSQRVLWEGCKQCASSKHCCLLCTSSAPWVAKSRSNAIGSLWSGYSSYVKVGSNLKQAMKYNSVVNPHLLTGQDDCLVLSIIYFPELHFLIGIVGKLVKEFDSNSRGRKSVYGCLDGFLHTQCVQDCIPWQCQVCGRHG